MIPVVPWISCVFYSRARGDSSEENSIGELHGVNYKRNPSRKTNEAEELVESTVLAVEKDNENVFHKSKEDNRKNQ